jgi:hypothetical protein
MRSEVFKTSVNNALDRSIFPDSGLQAPGAAEATEIDTPKAIGVSTELRRVQSALAEHRANAEEHLSVLTNRLSIFDSFRGSTSHASENRRLGEGGSFVVKCGVSNGAVRIELDIKPAGPGRLGLGKTPMTMQVTLYVEDAPIRADPIQLSAPGQLYCSKDEVRGWLSSEPTQWSERSIVEKASAYLRNAVDRAVEAIVLTNAGLSDPDLRPSFELELVSRCAQALNTPSLLPAYVAEREKQTIHRELKEIRAALSQETDTLVQQLETLALRFTALQEKLTSEPPITEAISRFAEEIATERAQLLLAIKKEISGNLQDEFELYRAELARRRERERDQPLVLKLNDIAFKVLPSNLSHARMAECASLAARGYPRSNLSSDGYCRVFEAIVSAVKKPDYYDSTHEEYVKTIGEFAAEAGEFLADSSVDEFVQLMKQASSSSQIRPTELESIGKSFFGETGKSPNSTE